MEQTSMKWRIINIHDTEENWNKTVDFIPKAGEQIIYDVDMNHSYERLKIGDGVTKVQDLPFVINSVIESLFNIKNSVLYADGGKISSYTDNTNT